MISVSVALAAALVQAQGPVPANPLDGASLEELQTRASAVFTWLDADADGLLSGAEQTKLTGSGAPAWGSALRGALSSADTNRDYRVSPDEMKVVIAARFAAMDTNSDGRLSRDERPDAPARQERRSGQQPDTGMPEQDGMSPGG